MQNNTSHFLVTGANGFVGRALCAELQQRGYTFSAMVRNPNQPDLSGSKKIIQLTDSRNNELDFQGVDIVIHLAARVHVMNDDNSEPLHEYLKVNLEGTTHLARKAALAGVKRFVFVSSIKVNGESTRSHPYTEIVENEPQDPYGISKFLAEKALVEISHETGMEVVILRPPLIYGPGVKANFLQLLKLVSKEVPLPLGNILNKRSLVYLSNFVDALILAALHPAAAHQTYLVSDGEDVSTPQLVGMIADALNRPNRVFPFPVSLMRFMAKMAGKAAVMDRLAQSLLIDSSKIRNELGWRPPFTMRQGLAATAEWYRRISGARQG